MNEPFLIIILINNEVVYDRIGTITALHPNAHVECNDGRKLYLTQAHIKKEQV